MNFPQLLLIASVAAIAAVYSLFFVLRRRYRKEGRPIKYLLFKITVLVGTPILLLPMWFSEMTLKGKFIATFLATGGAIAHYVSLSEFRKGIRKQLGLSYDEDWEDPPDKEK